MKTKHLFIPALALVLSVAFVGFGLPGIRASQDDREGKGDRACRHPEDHQ
jgi:hypothetical protein